MKRLQIVTFKKLKSFSELHLGELNINGCLQNLTRRDPFKDTHRSPSLPVNGLGFERNLPCIIVYSICASVYGKKSTLSWFEFAQKMYLVGKQQRKASYHLVLKSALRRIL